MSKKKVIRSRLTSAERIELDAYVLAYKTRGIQGMWWTLATAIEKLLKENDKLRGKP